jgi:hypothetical protein
MRCEYKLSYTSRQTAQKVRQKTLFEQGIRLYIYRCVTCKNLHLTKKRWLETNTNRLSNTK